MDPLLLRYYNRELQYLREMGGEFAKEFPKVASRLGLDGFECADPYVERLLEGFSFLAGRVQLKLDAEFPRFTQHLLEMVYPHYLAPTPSMTVVQLQPDLAEGALAEGFPVKRDSILRSLLGKGEQTPCEYRTAHDVTLWPLEVVEAEYFTNLGANVGKELPCLRTSKAGIRIRLRATAGMNFNQLPIDRLQFYLHGSDQMPMRIYEQIIGNSVAALVRPTQRPYAWIEQIAPANIKRYGFHRDQALLPYTARSFDGYRLLQEYFAFPSRFLFIDLGDLRKAMQRCEEPEIDILFLFNRVDRELENQIDHSHFALFCTPAVNLFPKRADRIHLNERDFEYQVIPDRTRPLDFEVYQVQQVVGHGTRSEQEQEFYPFYAHHDLVRHRQSLAYFTVRRERRLLSSKSRRYGPRSSYIGNEIYVALNDAAQAPYHSKLRQLSVVTLCTNRDLPLQMPVNQGETDFTMESGAPVVAVRCLAGPTKPMSSPVEGDVSWRLISHLALNYLSLINSDETKGAAALREMLMLYGDANDTAIQRQIESVKQVTSKPITRRLPIPGPISFGRGLEITLQCDETGFEGSGVFLLGAILEEFFAKYVSINSFTETVVKTERGEIMRWPIQAGKLHIL